MTAAAHGKETFGIHFALLATMAVWALNVTALKWLAGATDVMLATTLRMLCCAAALTVMLVLARQQFPRWRGRMLILAIASGLLMVYANQTLFSRALERTTASNAALILALNPLINAALESLVFRKRLSATFIGGALLAVAGVLMVVLTRAGAEFVGPSLGDVLVVASMFAFATGVLVLQRLSRDTAAVALNTFLYAVGAVALLVHIALTLPAPLAQLQALDWQVWTVIFFSSVVATALGGVAWARGVAALGMGRAAVYMSWVPVMGVGFSALLLGEQLTQWHFFGMILVLSGTILCSARFQRPMQPSKL